MHYLVGCNDAVLKVFLNIVRNGLKLIQIIGPILLICSITFLLIKLMQNPEDKKLQKRIVNSCLSLLFVFFIPLLVIASLNMVDEASNFGACWRSTDSGGGFGSSEYISTGDSERTTIIGDSEYEHGILKQEDDVSKDNNSKDHSSGNKSEEVKPIINNGRHRVIFIGDSRTVGMYSYVANTWKNNSYSTGGINQVGNDLFVAQGSMGLSWMKNTAIPAAKKYFKNDVSIVILMGVNDLRNQDSYISYLNDNVSSWISTGAKVYFVSVNPRDGDYSHMNSKINTFNTNLKKRLSSKIGWINTHDNLAFKTLDGLHYNKNTSINIYNYIKNHV